MLSHGQVQENLTTAVSLSPNFGGAPLQIQGCSYGTLGGDDFCRATLSISGPTAK